MLTSLILEYVKNSALHPQRVQKWPACLIVIIILASLSFGIAEYYISHIIYRYLKVTNYTDIEASALTALIFLAQTTLLSLYIYYKLRRVCNEGWLAGEKNKVSKVVTAFFDGFQSNAK